VACILLGLLAAQQLLEAAMMLCVSRRRHFAWLYPLWLRRLVPRLGSCSAARAAPAVNALSIDEVTGWGVWSGQ